MTTPDNISEHKFKNIIYLPPMFSYTVCRLVGNAERNGTAQDQPTCKMVAVAALLSAVLGPWYKSAQVMRPGGRSESARPRTESTQNVGQQSSFDKNGGPLNVACALILALRQKTGTKPKNQLKRVLGINRPPKDVLSYTDAMKLNKLWLSYMKTVINLQDLVTRGWNGKPCGKHWSGLMTSLYKCDYHGAHVKVISSKCCSYIGVQGVIVLETKNTFQIVGPDDTLKTVPKNGCVFEIVLQGHLFHIYGQHFITRSKDRSKKKLKDNLLLQL